MTTRGSTLAVALLIPQSFFLSLTDGAVASTTPDLTTHGYPNVWDGIQHGLLASPSFVEQSLTDMKVERNTFDNEEKMDLGFSVHENVLSVEECASICQNETSPAPGGTYFASTSACHCHYSVDCLLPLPLMHDDDADFAKGGVAVFSQSFNIRLCASSPCDLFKGDRKSECNKQLVGQVGEGGEATRGRNSVANEPQADKEARTTNNYTKRVSSSPTSLVDLPAVVAEETTMEDSRDQHLVPIMDEKSNAKTTGDIDETLAVFPDYYNTTDIFSVGEDLMDSPVIMEIDTASVGSSSPMRPNLSSASQSGEGAASELGLLNTNHTSAITHIAGLSPFTLVLEFEVPAMPDSAAIEKGEEAHGMFDVTALRGQEEDELLSQSRIHLQEYCELQILKKVSAAHGASGTYHDSSLRHEDHQMAVVLSFGTTKSTTPGITDLDLEDTRTTSRMHSSNRRMRATGKLMGTDITTRTQKQGPSVTRGRVRGLTGDQTQKQTLLLERTVEGEIIFYNTSYAPPSQEQLDQITKEAFTKPIQRAMFINLLSASSIAGSGTSTASHAHELGIFQYLRRINVTVWSANNDTGSGAVTQEVSPTGSTSVLRNNQTIGDSFNAEEQEQEEDLDGELSLLYANMTVESHNATGADEQEFYYLYANDDDGEGGENAIRDNGKDGVNQTNESKKKRFPYALVYSVSFVVGCLIVLSLVLLIMTLRKEKRQKREEHRLSHERNASFPKEQRFVRIPSDPHNLC
jgi:hypothetical protein